MKKPAFALVLFLLSAAPAAFAWTSQTGIPAPPWPSNLDMPRPAIPDAWSSDRAGYYFVSAGGCSDSRTYGNPTAPRCTLPASPPAGAVVVLDGTYANGSETLAWTKGTSASPVWLRAYDAAPPPTITGTVTFSGKYVVVDAIRFSNSLQDGNMRVSASANHHLFRNCSYQDSYSSSPGEAINLAGDNIVLYRISVGPVGNWNYTAGDIDRHGVKVDSGASGIWVLDSVLFHCQGDGIQVGDQNNARSAITRVFIGRNVVYENLQTGFWVKNATDVVIAGNTAYNMTKHTSWSESAGFGGQYDPAHVWFVNNHVYNSINGILIMGGSSNNGGPWHVVGNLFENLHSNTCNNYDYGTIHYRNAGGVSIVNNTMHRVDSYVTTAYGSGVVRASGNLFGQQHPSTSCPALNMDTGGTFDYNLYHSNGVGLAFSGNSYASVALFASGTGQESHRVTGDPAFADATGGDFTLRAASPAIGQANPVEESVYAAFLSRYGVSIRTDRRGISRPQDLAWDIGAYEYAAGASEPRIPNPPTSLRIE